MNNVSKITYDFKGGDIGNDAGGIALYEYAEHIGLRKRLKEVFDEKKTPGTSGAEKKYSKGDVLFQSIAGNMLGYKNQTEVSKLRNDPVLNVLSGDDIASQPTFSRTLSGLTEEDEKNLKTFNKDMIRKYFESLVEKNGGKKLPRIDISDDSTAVKAYGKQEGAEYISHYGVVGYHPDLVTEDSMRLILSGVLRNGNVYSSTGSELLIEEVIDFLSPFAEKIVFRADSAYAKPEVLEVLRKRKAAIETTDAEKREPVEIEYYIKAKTYWSWIEKANMEVKWEGKTYHPLRLPKEYFEATGDDGKKKRVPRFFSFSHQCASWKQPETIVLQMRYREKKDQPSLLEEMNKEVQLLITNAVTPPVANTIMDEDTNPDMSPDMNANMNADVVLVADSEEQEKAAFKEYGKRGKQEQIIEEFKNDSFGKTLSNKEKTANSCVMLLKIIAHNLMQILRLETLSGTEYANCRVSTTRTLLFRIGGKFVRHGRKIILRLSSGFVFRKWFELVMKKIPRIVFRLC